MRKLCVGVVLCVLGASAAAEVPEQPPTQRSPSELRAGGAEVLRRMLADYDAGPSRWTSADIDAVAGQYGALRSRLYWHTDLQSALAAAKAEGKPVLYLRMLGKLTDEYSCANSRFFRTALYSNKKVSELLREKFVLVWESERPVPVVTIDYGDGRVLKRTLTGNSIHYVLDQEGRVVDALPGLYGPEAFRRVVEEAGRVALKNSPAEAKSYQVKAIAALSKEYDADEKRASLQPLPEPLDAAAGRARGAMDRTWGKRAVEFPVMNAVMANAAGGSTDSGSEVSGLLGIAALHRDECRLDERSREVVREQSPGSSEQAIATTITRFEEAMALDTVRNNYEFRTKILGWLASDPQAPVLMQLNERVYTELFLMPRSDAWLGLAPESTYTGLSEDSARVQTRK